MPEHQRSYGRFLPTYATLVGLPALALFVTLRIGNGVEATVRPLSPRGPESPAPLLRTMMVSATLTIMPLSGVGRWLLRLVGRRDP